MTQHESVSRFPHYISCYIAESRFPLGQCRPNKTTVFMLTRACRGPTWYLIVKVRLASVVYRVDMISLYDWFDSRFVRNLDTTSALILASFQDNPSHVLYCEFLTKFYVRILEYHFTKTNVFSIAACIKSSCKSRLR